MANRVVHFDIYADDVERASAFYQKVFGWTIRKVDGMDYWLVSTGEGEPGIDGGLGQRTSPTNGDVPQFGYTCTVDVEDVNATFEAAVAAGGTEVHKPGAIPGVGYIAYVRDTEGNHLGLMQSDHNVQ
jgi:predicted enzyme related to lactoylglutathione lyase